ncbi:SH3 domain-containing protein [Proteiniclasticum sp. C24MP]|uniref:C40 family peptidase n=1 Tax=Proteiniclasticum sp. C24MP TaxID=3374101 RepID=UPI0037544083
MKNFKLKKLIATAILASVITTTSGTFQGRDTASVYAAEIAGSVTVTAGSLWTYARADWNAKTQVVNRGDSFSLSEKIVVDGREMYGLTNGLYITANPAYIQADEVEVASSYKTTTENLNMRTGNSTSYGIILTIPKGSQVEVLSTLNGWDQVTYNGKTGWASAKYLTASAVSAPAPAPAPAPVSSVTFKNTTHNLNMRTGNSTDHSVLLTIPQGGRVEVLASMNGWDQVLYNGQIGWSSAKYLTAASSQVTGEDIVSYAKQFLGVKYTWGGNSPEEGFDCSGIIKYVYGHYGITTPRVSRYQATFGEEVSMDALRPGDLIYFGRDTVTHIGIYVGGNDMLHAPEPGKFVEIKDLTWHVNNYRIVGARRYIK